MLYQIIFREDISRSNIIKVSKICKLAKKLRKSLGYSLKYYNINSFFLFDSSSEVLYNNKVNLRRFEKVSLSSRIIANS